MSPKDPALLSSDAARTDMKQGPLRTEDIDFSACFRALEIQSSCFAFLEPFFFRVVVVVSAHSLGCSAVEVTAAAEEEPVVVVATSEESPRSTAETIGLMGK